ncbi:MAG TPA: M20/M25/M40 family metallo-hydrolase [Chloroflexota bacterium]|nr:M20/M25/M40 family metallo-hydrolase [Chloroflexota bacterium]
MDIAAAAERAWQHISAERLLQTTYRFVETPSPTGQERAFALRYAAYLGEIGLEVQLDEEFPDSPSVLAWWPGTRRRPILQFDGHTDTIPTPHAAPSLDSTRGIVRGRGAADMKGGLAAVAEALRALRAAGVALDGSILLTAHGLHEAPLGDQRTLRSLIRKGIHGDAAIVAELGEHALPLAAKGMLIFRIEIGREGMPMHEAEAPTTLPHPLWAAGRMLALLDERRRALQEQDVPLLGPESIFLGEVHGGDFYNRVPVSARIVGTHRFAAPRTAAQVEAEYLALCLRVEAETGATARCTVQEVGRPFRLDEDTPIVRYVRAGYLAATGHALPVQGINVVGNAADLVGLAGIPAVYHGVNQSTAHSDDEFVLAADLVRAARVYAWAALAYCAGADRRDGEAPC